MIREMYLFDRVCWLWSAGQFFLAVCSFCFVLLDGIVAGDPDSTLAGPTFL
jgi:hypothetical protein